MPARNDPKFEPNPWNEPPSDQVARAENEANAKRKKADFPRRVYRKTASKHGEQSRLVESEKELKELGPEWVDAPPAA